MKNVILIGLLAGIFLSAAGPDAKAQSSLKQKIDSLFIIASSGEVRYRDQNEPAMDSIAAIGRPAVPFLIDKFTTKSARERWTIIWTLERIGSAAVPDLVQALKLDNGLVVQRVAWALGRIKDSAAVGPLIDVADHPMWQVRDQAVTALGNIGDEEAAPTIMDALTDTIGQVRKSAVVATGKLRINAAAEQLTRMLADDYYGARLDAVDALRKLDTAAVVEVLGEAMSWQPMAIGNLATVVLGDLATDRAKLVLFEQTKAADPERRVHAILALIKADPRDNCGYRSRYMAVELGRLDSLKVQSALTDVSDGS